MEELRQGVVKAELGREGALAGTAGEWEVDTAGEDTELRPASDSDREQSFLLLSSSFSTSPASRGSEQVVSSARARSVSLSSSQE